MELIEMLRSYSEEEKVEDFLREVGILKSFKRCFWCGNKYFGKIRRNVYRCHKCKREWSVRKGSILEGTRISFTKFIMLIKLFELEIPVRRACKELQLSYNTVHKFYTRLRKMIYNYTTRDDLLKGEIEADESYFGGRSKGMRGRGSKNKIPVFGILERGGRVKVEIVKDVSAESLLKETIKKVKRGSLIYTDKFRSYDSLVLYGFRHERIDHGKRFANGKVYINGIEGFWSYAKGKLLKFHGLSPELFPYYLKELEFRYNNRNANLFDKFFEIARGGIN